MRARSEFAVGIPLISTEVFRLGRSHAWVEGLSSGLQREAAAVL